MVNLLEAAGISLANSMVVKESESGRVGVKKNNTWAQDGWSRIQMTSTEGGRSAPDVVFEAVCEE